MVFFLLCLCVFVSFFAIAINVTGYLSVDRECMIFVVKVYGVKAFKIIVQKVNGIFEITINGQSFDKKPKKSQKNLNLRKLIAIKKITLIINSDGDEFITAMIKGAVKSLKNDKKASDVDAGGFGMSVTPVGILIAGEKTTYVGVDKNYTEDKWINLLKTVADTVRK